MTNWLPRSEADGVQLNAVLTGRPLDGREGVKVALCGTPAAVNVTVSEASGSEA